MIPLNTVILGLDNNSIKIVCVFILFVAFLVIKNKGNLVQVRDVILPKKLFHEKTVCIESPLEFYDLLFCFLFNSTSLYFCCVRLDLSDTFNCDIYDIFCRTDNPILFRNLTVEFDSENESIKSVLKDSSLLISSRITENKWLRQEEQRVYGLQKNRMERLNMNILSERLIFSNRVLEIISVDKTLTDDNTMTENVSELINSIFDKDYDFPPGEI